MERCERGPVIGAGKAWVIQTWAVQKMRGTKMMWTTMLILSAEGWCEERKNSDERRRGEVGGGKMVSSVIPSVHGSS